MIWARIVPVFALAMIVGACKTAPPAKPACPERVTTWMACPGPSAKEGSVCQVYGPPLGCGFDEVALDYARHQHTSRDLGLRGRFYVFAIEVTARGQVAFMMMKLLSLHRSAHSIIEISQNSLRP